jgi:acyl-CoA synthetase (AMP-forming)/AMP-acid ligase II
MDPIGMRESDDVAVLGEGGEFLTYRQLSRLVDRLARSMPGDRKVLVGLLGDRDLGTLVGYLGALRIGHVVAWLGAARSAPHQRDLVLRYRPEVVIGSAREVRAAVDAARYTIAGGPVDGVHIASLNTPVDEPDLNRDTSVLLFTSGSTGGSRAVRLAGKSIATNSEWTCSTLRIDARSRSATSLPLYYTYGLSVVNTHLAAGGSILLTRKPSTGVAFWKLFARSQCQIFSGVPMHLEWLQRNQHLVTEVESLTKITSSGSRIRASVATRFHELCESTGRQYFKMYGQTEATARISVLQHDDFTKYPDSVGRVLAGSRVTIADTPDDSSEPNMGIGRVIYHGPCAMQGYAEDRSALSKEDEMEGVVDTGDLGFVKEGFLHLTGRAGRFVKPAGKRLELDHLEDVFSEVASAAAVGGPDERAHVFVESRLTSGLEAMRLDLAGGLGLAANVIELHTVEHLPRRPSGKVDYRSLGESVCANAHCE